MNNDNTQYSGQMQAASDDELLLAVGGTWWNDAVAFAVGAYHGWNLYEPRDRTWSEISYPSCDCTSQ